MRKEKHLEESISEIKFRYHTKSEAYMNKSSDINELSEMPEPVYCKDHKLNKMIKSGGH